jgi:transcriptional repressor NrdR
MKCPFCGFLEDKVVDSRLGKDGTAIRRRRECMKCHSRFTTYEKIERLPVVVKKDGRRDPFVPDKILSSIKQACVKRSVSIEDMESLVNKVEKGIQESGIKEIDSAAIGEIVLAGLRELDEVASIRFASVYKNFENIESFMKELQTLLYKKKMEQS